MSQKIGVFLENKIPNVLANVGLELLSETNKQLAGNDYELYGIYLGEKISKEDLSKVAATGTSKLIVCKDRDLNDYDTDRYAVHLQNINEKYKFDVLLIGSSLIGRDLGPRLSAKLKTGLTADATKLDFEVTPEKITLLATRPALGGNIFATIICPKTVPQMATIRPGVFKIETSQKNALDILEFPYTPISSRVHIINKLPKPNKSVDLQKAKLIISGGRGIADSYDQVIELANLLGVEYASSRALVDTHVTEKARQVGQTGQTVSPLIYLSFGISGAIQHIAGIEKSDQIIAINNDSTAPIFEVADVGIVSDAKEILPKLIKRIKELKGIK
jgi:electron transfer flavoprotein alpha subunit